MPLRIDLTRDAAETVKALSPPDLASYRRLLNLIRMYPGIGQYYATINRQAYYAVFGMGVYVVYRREINRILVAWVDFWTPSQGFYDKP